MNRFDSRDELFEAWSREIFLPAGSARNATLPVDKNTRIDFIANLFRNFERHSAHYSEDKVAAGLRRFVHPGWSDEMFLLYDGDIDIPKRAAAIESLAGVLDYFGKKCPANLNAKRGSKLSPLNELGLDWWDIFPAHPDSDDPARKEVDTAFLSLFRNALESSSPVVQELALHGLGHWQHAYPEEVGGMISAYLSRTPNLDPELKKYAEAAREGMVH